LKLTSKPTDSTEIPTQSPTKTEYFLWEAGSASECPIGAEVPEDECFAAGTSLSDGLINPSGFTNDVLNEDDWDFTPCGCFFWNWEHKGWNRLLDYNLGDGPCKKTDMGSVICKKPQLINYALSGTASQSCNKIFPKIYSPDKAINGITTGVEPNFSHTCREFRPWWQVDLGQPRLIKKIVVWNRTDCCSERLSNGEVMILDESGNVVGSSHIGDSSGKTPFIFEYPEGVLGNIVKVQLSTQEYLHLGEVQVF